MKFVRWLVLLTLIAPAVIAQHRSPGLGTSAAVAPDGTLWIAHVEGSTQPTRVVVRSTRDRGKTWSGPQRVMTTPEPVSADGENRPKLAIGPKSELYVTWTTPTSPKYTGDVRFVRSLDGGKNWSEPVNVHRDRQVITHRFESLLVDARGRVWVTWIDKRDLHAAERRQQPYAGAAIYYAYSDDQGATWRGDYKLTDHTCECCRIALTSDIEGQAVAMWRHVFDNSERDHALARLTPSGTEPSIQRATFDRWRIDACPHHGPSLTYSADGRAHAVWFNQIDGEGRAFYGQLGGKNPSSVQQLPAGAAHADVAVFGSTVAIAWKRFDGEATLVETMLSTDGGRTFKQGATLRTQADSDQPRVLSDGRAPILVWRTADRVEVKVLGGENPASRAASTPAPLGETASSEIKPFTRDALALIEQSHRGRPFWLILWDLECTYCMKSLQNLGRAQKQNPHIRVVTIATDPVSARAELSVRLKQFDVKGEHYAFGAGSPESLRYAIDPKWLGEKPRAYRYAVNGERRTVNGVIDESEFLHR